NGRVFPSKPRCSVRWCRMPKKPTPTFSPAYAAFLSSMEMNLEKWREGIGFDLTSLKNVTEVERDLLVQLLVKRLEKEGDWREIEALAAIATPEAMDAIRRAAEHGSSETRLY